MSPPKVSILIPVYNGEPFLTECLDSVLAQDFTNLEILIADDDSTDGSVALLEQYAAKDRRIRWWKNPHNLGLAGNFNRCLQAAQGEYIKYVLQDDKLLSPATVSLMTAALDSHPTVALVGSASYLLDARSRPTGLRKYFSAGLLAGRRAILRCLEQPANMIGEPSVVMFRRARVTGGFDERYPQGLDLEFWFRLLEKGDHFFYLTKPLCAFRQHAKQETQRNRRLSNKKEPLMLLERYYAQSWFRSMMTKKLLFAQLYSLRRDPEVRAESLYVEMKKNLGPSWYLLYLIRRMLTGPLKKIGLWIARQSVMSSRA